MKRYRATHGQNIYDVALHIYGSVEGVVDLMALNEALSLAGDLRAGDELFYSDGYLINPEVAAYYATHGVTPASGEMNVYPKSFLLPRCVEIYTSNGVVSAGFACSGSGEIEVDWGDNSPAESITLGDEIQNVTHIFDSTVTGSRKVVFYINAYFKTLDISDLHPLEMYLLRPLNVERFKLSNASIPLDSLAMLNGCFRMNLDNVESDNLLPLIELKELMELNLVNFDYPQPTIDAYLIGLVEKYSNRRNCHIKMQCTPSGRYEEPQRDANNRYILTSGMEALWVLANEPAWNEGGTWKFSINNIFFIYNGTNN